MKELFNEIIKSLTQLLAAFISEILALYKAFKVKKGN